MVISVYVCVCSKWHCLPDRGRQWLAVQGWVRFVCVVQVFFLWVRCVRMCQMCVCPWIQNCTMRNTVKRLAANGIIQKLLVIAPRDTHHCPLQYALPLRASVPVWHVNYWDHVRRISWLFLIHNATCWSRWLSYLWRGLKWDLPWITWLLTLMPLHPLYLSPSRRRRLSKVNQPVTCTLVKASDSFSCSSAAF